MQKIELDMFLYLEVLSDLDEFIINLLHDKYKDDEEKHKKYDKLFRLLILCLELKKRNIEIFDWKYLIENGKFCKHDFDEDRFKDWLNREGYSSYEEAYKIYENNRKKNNLK